jgi:hypothetical protein
MIPAVFHPGVADQAAGFDAPAERWTGATAPSRSDGRS